jgi:hypothetical protein
MCTREKYQQARHFVVEMLDSGSVIPDAHSPEQAWAVTLVLHKLKADWVSSQPIPLRSARPRPATSSSSSCLTLNPP